MFLIYVEFIFVHGMTQQSTLCKENQCSFYCLVSNISVPHLVEMQPLPYKVCVCVCVCVCALTGVCDSTNFLFCSSNPFICLLLPLYDVALINVL